MLREDRAEQERSKRSALVKKEINLGQDMTSTLPSDSDTERIECEKEQQRRRRSAFAKGRKVQSEDSTSPLSSDSDSDRVECEKQQEERSKRSALLGRRDKSGRDRTSTPSSDEEADEIDRETEKRSASCVTRSFSGRSASVNYSALSPFRSPLSLVATAASPKTGINDSDDKDEDQYQHFDSYENNDGRPDAEEFTENEYLPSDDSNQGEISFHGIKF